MPTDSELQLGLFLHCPESIMAGDRIEAHSVSTTNVKLNIRRRDFTTWQDTTKAFFGLH